MKFAFDQFKTQEIYKVAVLEKRFSLIFVSNDYKAHQICEKALEKELSALPYDLDEHKTW